MPSFKSRSICVRNITHLCTQKEIIMPLCVHRLCDFKGGVFQIRAYLKAVFRGGVIGSAGGFIYVYVCMCGCGTYGYNTSTWPWGISFLTIS